MKKDKMSKRVESFDVFIDDQGALFAINEESKYANPTQVFMQHGGGRTVWGSAGMCQNYFTYDGEEVVYVHAIVWREKYAPRQLDEFRAQMRRAICAVRELPKLRKWLASERPRAIIQIKEETK